MDNNFDNYNVNMQNEFMSTIASHVLGYIEKVAKGNVTVEYSDMVLLITIENSGYQFYHEVDLSTGLYAKNDLSAGIARFILKVYREKVLAIFFK